MPDRPPESREPSLWDILRLIERNHADNQNDILELKALIAEIRADSAIQLEKYLPREVYLAKEELRMRTDASQDRRIDVIEEEMRQARARTSTAIWTAIASVIATVLAAIILYAILGGKP
jgi:hypothetical protein